MAALRASCAPLLRTRASKAKGDNGKCVRTRRGQLVFQYDHHQSHCRQLIAMLWTTDKQATHREDAMGRFFGLIMMLVALYFAMNLYTKGIDHTLDGAFAPIEPAADSGAPLATHLTSAAQMADPPMERERRVWVTDAVRERVSEDIASGARRRGY